MGNTAGVDADPPTDGTREDHASGHRLWRRAGRFALVATIAALGGWLGLLVGGRTSTSIGPLEVNLHVALSFTGDTVLHVPPLGSVTVDSHDGPLRLDATVEGVNIDNAREIFDDPRVLEGLEGRILADVRSGVTAAIIRGVAAGTAGAVGLGLLAMRPRRRAALTGATALGLMVGSTGVAAASIDRDSILEPTYTGLITSAPALFGDAETIAANFADYREGLVSMISRVSRLYDVTSTLPVYQASDDTIRVLHVSDLHVNPTSWAVIRSVVEQFEVDVVVDTGDIVHQGTVLENGYVEEISTVPVPYVFVRGNHDSRITERAVAAEPNAVVLDRDVVEVAGLTFFGAGDPRFTPDKSQADLADEAERLAGQRAADDASRAGEKIDVALMHNPVAARELDGVGPVILCGHMHARDREVLPGGSWLFQQGSTGASGINALRNEKPTPITLTVLYFDSRTSELEAWDDITLGGLGLTSAEIERHLASSFAGGAPPTDTATSPSPGETVGN